MVGERVSPNTVIARVIDTSSLTAEVEINEYDLPLISEGLAIELRFDAIPGEVFTGELSRISPEGTVNAQGLAVVAAEILIEDPDPRIVPSYSFLAEILLSGEDAVLAVEEEAVIERQGRTIAFLAPGEGERAVPRVVQTEALGGGLVRVVSGLEEGDVVLDAAGLLDVIGENGGPGPFRRPPLGRRIFGGGGAGARRGAGGGDAGFDGPPAEGRRPGGGLGPGSGADQNGVGR
jgi:multidrug efflux pump subunit AcrA (membrane-fusion protein)